MTNEVSPPGPRSIANLPASSWTESYYDPLASRMGELGESWRGIADAEVVLEQARNEIAVFRACGEFYGYAFFVMQRAGD